MPWHTFKRIDGFEVRVPDRVTLSCSGVLAVWDFVTTSYGLTLLSFAEHFGGTYMACASHFPWFEVGDVEI